MLGRMIRRGKGPDFLWLLTVQGRKTGAPYTTPVAPVRDHGETWLVSPYGEVYVLGDNPLVLLTALWTAFEPDPATSKSVIRPCPRLLASGLYEERLDGRPIRVFTSIDRRLMLDDLFAKLDLHSAAD